MGICLFLKNRKFGEVSVRRLLQKVSGKLCKTTKYKMNSRKTCYHYEISLIFFIILHCLILRAGGIYSVVIDIRLLFKL